MDTFFVWLPCMGVPGTGTSIGERLQG